MATVVGEPGQRAHVGSVDVGPYHRLVVTKDFSHHQQRVSDPGCIVRRQSGVSLVVRQEFAAVFDDQRLGGEGGGGEEAMATVIRGGYRDGQRRRDHG